MLVRPMARCNGFQSHFVEHGHRRAGERTRGDHQKTAPTSKTASGATSSGRASRKDSSRRSCHPVQRSATARPVFVPTTWVLPGSNAQAAWQRAVASRSPFSPDVEGVLASLLRQWPSGACPQRRGGWWMSLFEDGARPPCAPVEAARHDDATRVRGDGGINGMAFGQDAFKQPLAVFTYGFFALPRVGQFERGAVRVATTWKPLAPEKVT